MTNRNIRTVYTVETSLPSCWKKSKPPGALGITPSRRPADGRPSAPDIQCCHSYSTPERTADARRLCPCSANGMARRFVATYCTIFPL